MPVLHGNHVPGVLVLRAARPGRQALQSRLGDRVRRMRARHPPAGGAGHKGSEEHAVSAEDARPFEPDWTLAPGDCLAELLELRGITEAGLADRTRLGPETIAGILAASTAVDGLIAEKLSAVFGMSAQFWLNYEAIYRADLARGAKRSAR
jgi:plasmid maintenance system antidote protein VapI